MDPSVLKQPQGMDPHQRVVLEVGYEACHHAGYSKGKLMNKIGRSLSLCSPIRFSSQDSFSWQNLRWFDHLRFSISKRFSKVAFILAAARAFTAPNTMLFPRSTAQRCESRTVFGMVSEVSGATGAAASINSNRFSFCFSERYEVKAFGLKLSFSRNLHSPWTSLPLSLSHWFL